MIFEEIESAGAEIVSVSEHIDNTLTGKLIRSILAWSAESERHKIVEYAKQNKYDMCPSLTNIRTSPLDEIVWQECCILFKRIDVLQAALKQEMEAAINALLEDTTGQEQIRQIEANIATGKHEREKYATGSYMHNLISADITRQEEQLMRFQEEIGSNATETAVNAYQQRIMDFLAFLNVIRGRYERTTFQEKRNALEVLGVHVVVRPLTDTYGVDCGHFGYRRRAGMVQR